jgi:superkiller protein 3
MAAVPAASGWPPPAREEVSPETAAQLRALGYVSSSAPLEATFGAEDDPKRLIGLDRLIHQVVELYSLGKAKEAVTLARELVAKRPTMPLGYSFLAQALLEAGNTPGAVEVMNAARAKGVASESVMRQLALSLAELGRAVEGAALLAPLAQAHGSQTGDLETLLTYGQVLSEAGRQQEATSVLQQVLARDADHPKAHETLGLVALRAGRLPEARQESEKALAANPGLPLAWNNLGVALYQLGDVPGALDAWERAVTLDPKLYDALYNLGFKAAEHGRLATARQALERFAATAPAARYAADVAEARRMLARLPGG